MLSLLRMIRGVGAQGREPLQIINTQHRNMEYSTNTEYTAVSHTGHASVGSADSSSAKSALAAHFQSAALQAACEIPYPLLLNPPTPRRRVWCDSLLCILCLYCIPCFYVVYLLLGTKGPKTRFWANSSFHFGPGPGMSLISVHNFTWNEPQL